MALSESERARRARQSAESRGTDGNDEDDDNDLDAQPLSPDIQAQVNTFLDDALAVNLDEVSPEPVTVAFREWDEVRMDEHTTRRHMRVRHAEIETFVPMLLFNRMMASRQQAQRMRAIWKRNGGDKTEDPMLGWVRDQVLAVWQLTEPEMTRERLESGLTFMQAQGLFARFFDDALRQKRNSHTAG